MPPCPPGGRHGWWRTDRQFFCEPSKQWRRRAFGWHLPSWWREWSGWVFTFPALALLPWACGKQAWLFLHFPGRLTAPWRQGLPTCSGLFSLLPVDLPNLLPPGIYHNISTKMGMGWDDASPCLQPSQHKHKCKQTLPSMHLCSSCSWTTPY